MTFFLNQQAEAPKIKANNPDIDLDFGWWGGLGAGITSGQLETDSNFVAARRTVTARDDLAKQVLPRLGMDRIRPIIEERNAKALANGMPSRVVEMPDNAEDAVELLGPNFSQRALEMAREAAADNPDAWADLDLSDEAIVAAANEKMRAEYEDAQAMLDMMPTGGTAARLLGGMIGMTLDVRNAPFLLMGGGSGSIMRIMGREAAINMGAELAFLPAQFKQAERLDIPDPDVATQLAIAAGAGGILGGLIAGVPRAYSASQRAYSYIKGRNAVPPMQGYDDIQARGLVDQAEDILTGDGANPLDQIQSMMDATTPRPYLLENPINPDRPPLIPADKVFDDAMARAQRGEVAAAGDTVPPPVTTEPLPPVDGGPREPLSDANLIESMKEAIKEAEARDNPAKQPLTNMLKSNHRVTKKAMRAAAKVGRKAEAGENMQVHPDGRAGQELKARGITSKTHPGLFSRNGRKDFDNLPASEMEEEFPGIIDATGTRWGDDYLDYDGFLDLIVRDANGDSTWLRTSAEVERLHTELDRLIEFGSGDGSAVDDFVSGQRAESGFFVDKDAYEFEHGNFAGDQIARDLDEYLDRNDLTFLTDAEKAEILSELQTRGGDAEYLVERAAEREIDLAAAKDATPDDIPFGDDAPAAARDVGQGAGRDGRSESPAAAEGTSAARADDAGGARTEATDAGEQFVAPGIEPVSQRQRLEAAQSAPVRGGNAAADVGLFDTGARAQTDMFSDIASPEAQAHMDAVASDMRTDIKTSGDIDVAVEGPDGSVRVVKASEALDELDADQEFLEIMELCGKAPA